MAHNDSTEVRNVSVRVTVRGPDTLLLRRDAGTAASGTEKWEMALDLGSGFPIVRGPDGRWVLFDWQALLEAARSALTKDPWPTWDELAELARNGEKSVSRVRLLNFIDKMKAEGQQPEHALQKQQFKSHRNMGVRCYDYMMNLVLAWRRR